MKKMIERLLLFFLGLPLIVASVLFLPYYNYLAFHIELLVFTFLAIIEMRKLVSQKNKVLPLPLLILIGMIIPVASFLYAVVGLPQRIITYSIAIAACIILIIEFILSFSGHFEDALERTASSFLILIYPGYLVMYLSIITVWQHAGSLLSVFFLMVFGCDSLAWFFGMLFGKKNRGLIPASPNKSIAGFAGGYAGSILAAFFGSILFPSVFNTSLLNLTILGILTASAAIIGDIVESIFKRSAEIKDSGNIIPGRGGVLDSIDSILLAAPVFYILCDYLLGFGK
ncbi:MAG TPA: phosphatidate cytidylyltransferase [Treponemataceae bacterium]|nr:phosphatidate cytidylyltransferase [Treponemataceae bacterium]